jgi:outer membrane protein OmpA-like peptidoglycan-associated protein
MDAHRAAILRRRASLIGASLAAVGCASQAPPPEPVTEAPTAVRAPRPQPSAPVPGVPVPSATVAMVCLSVRIVRAVEFPDGGVAPTSGGQASLDEALAVLRDNPDRRVALEGHTDGKEPAYGRKLGMLRARAVEQYLTAQGIDAARLCVVDYGPTRPLTPGKTPDERAKNRRVSFQLLGDGEPCP